MFVLDAMGSLSSKESGGLDQNKCGTLLKEMLFSFSCRYLFLQNKTRCMFFTDCAKGGNVHFNRDS